MGERRNHAGAALLGVAGLCWVSTVVADGTRQLAWGSIASVLLFAAGLLCLIGSLGAFGVLRCGWPRLTRRRSEQQPTAAEPPYRTEATVTHQRDKTDGGEGGSDSADESGIAYLRRRSQETLVGALESAEAAGRLLRAQDAPTPRAQPVSDAHRDLLKEVARKLRSYVDASQHAYYGAKGDERKAQAFQEHFPDVAGRVTAWNEQIAALEAERRELQEWVEGRLRALVYDQPPFAGGYAGLIADLAAVDGAELPFHVPQIQPLWLQLGPYPLIPDPPPNGRTREDIEIELRGVLSEARQQPQCQRIRQMRGSLAETSEPLISDLDLIQAKDVINGLGDCLLCR
jgi:hypothetical protein